MSAAAGNLMSEKRALSAGSLPGRPSDPQISEESGSGAATANTMCRRASVRYGCNSTGPPSSGSTVTQEVALGGIEDVGDAAAIAVARERERALDPVALGLDPDALLAVFGVLLVCVGGEVDGAHRVIIA
jgi:hypothetical protein